MFKWRKKNKVFEGSMLNQLNMTFVHGLHNTTKDFWVIALPPPAGVPGQVLCLKMMLKDKMKRTIA